jgi:hypothetical protein
MKTLHFTGRLSGCFRTVTGVLGVFAVVTTTHGAAISGSMHEAFDYPGGTQFANASSLNGGQGWNLLGNLDANAAAANWGTFQNGGDATGLYRTATAPGLTFGATGYLNGSGSMLTLNAAGNNVNQHVGRTLGGQVIDAGTTYFSLLVSKNIDTARTINFAFFGGPSNNERFAVGQIGAGGGNSAGNIALLMNNQNPAGLIQNAASPIAMGVGLTHLIVGEIIWNPGGFETVSIWVDPTDVTTQAAAGSAYLSTSGFELISLTGIRPFVGNTSGAFSAVSANFDEIRLGGSWESVTSLAVVPEPSTAALASIAGLMFCLVRNRK